MTNEEKDEMIGVLTRKMKDGDYLTDVCLVPVGGIATIVNFTALWGLIAFTTVVKVIHRIESGVVVSYYRKPEKLPFYLPSSYPCFQMSATEDNN